MSWLFVFACSPFLPSHANTYVFLVTPAYWFDPESAELFATVMGWIWINLGQSRLVVPIWIDPVQIGGPIAAPVAPDWWSHGCPSRPCGASPAPTDSIPKVQLQECLQKYQQHHKLAKYCKASKKAIKQSGELLEEMHMSEEESKGANRYEACQWERTKVSKQAVRILTNKKGRVQTSKLQEKFPMRKLVSMQAIYTNVCI